MTSSTLPFTLRRKTFWLMAMLGFLLAGPIFNLALGRASVSGDWRSATHRSTGLAPDAAIHQEAIVQVYASRAYGWRGAFADHTWLAVKAKGADHYTRYEVIGWYGGGGRSVVSVSSQRAPDAEWFGASPRLIRDVRGHDADTIISKLPKVVAAYPYADTYHAWPGPNSNTFIAFVARELPELHVKLPSTAIGKDFLSASQFVATPPSGSGFQVSLFGLLGIIASPDEGLELNVLGLVTGFELRKPALKLPGIGRIPRDGTLEQALPMADNSRDAKKSTQ